MNAWRKRERERERDVRGARKTGNLKCGLLEQTLISQAMILLSLTVLGPLAPLEEEATETDEPGAMQLPELEDGAIIMFPEATVAAAGSPYSDDIDGSRRGCLSISASDWC